MIRIEPAISILQYKQIEGLAKNIWAQHYTPIIGSEQVDYMLQKFQSAKAIETQIAESAEYYILFYKENPTGYFSVLKKEQSLFLSKLYVLDVNRGKGLGKAAMAFIQDRTLALGYDHITLTVNKYNTNSIKAYEKMGFENVEAIVQDIGKGYVMDDFVMKKKI